MQQENNSQNRTRTQPDCDSGIGQHLLKNRKSAKNYEDTKFSILTIARSQFQLRLWEATVSAGRRGITRLQTCAVRLRKINCIGSPKFKMRVCVILNDLGITKN